MKHLKVGTIIQEILADNKIIMELSKVNNSIAYTQLDKQIDIPSLPDSN